MVRPRRRDNAPTPDSPTPTAHLLDLGALLRPAAGSLCADPGTSNHGWAKAVDIGGCCGVDTGAGPAFDWLTANAPGFGWVHPAWAQPGGSKPEPWHWEFGSIS